MNPTPDNAIQFHSRIALQFAQKYQSSSAFRERYRIWTNLFERYVKPTDTVMDLGCGPGFFSRYLAGKECVVIGIDGSPVMINFCNEQQTVGRIEYDVQVLPLLNPAKYAGQDVIIASSLLEYIDDMPTLLQQINEILQPGGLFIVSMPNKRSIYRRAEQVIFKLTGRPRYVSYLRNVSTEAAFNQQLPIDFEQLETIYFAGHDPLSRLLKPFLSEPFVNNLFVGVYRKRPISAYEDH